MNYISPLFFFFFYIVFYLQKYTVKAEFSLAEL